MLSIAVCEPVARRRDGAARLGSPAKRIRRQKMSTLKKYRFMSETRRTPPESRQAPRETSPQPSSLPVKGRTCTGSRERQQWRLTGRHFPGGVSAG